MMMIVWREAKSLIVMLLPWVLVAVLLQLYSAQGQQLTQLQQRSLDANTEELRGIHRLLAEGGFVIRPLPGDER